ncbi:MAG: hypothetical protein IH874_03995 [Candidatus Dadabacteria bacterium]|nr:hypothetical protein [Candidatus Dadabacteria bacterium]
MKLKMLSSVKHDGEYYEYGVEYELDPKTGKMFIEKGWAEKLIPDTKRKKKRERHIVGVPHRGTEGLFYKESRDAGD